MQCKNCGREVSALAEKCPNCGTTLRESTGASVQRTIHTNNTTRTRVINRTVNGVTSGAESKMLPGFLCGLCLAMIGAIIGMCMFSNGSYERRTFMKGWRIGFAIVAVIAIIIGIVYGVVLAKTLNGYYY